jgi:hypothetical protein
VTVVRNLGPDPAVGVVAREIPQFHPNEANTVAHVLSLTTTSGDCTQRRPVRCVLGTLAPGASVTIRTRTRIMVVAALRSIVVVSSQTEDPNTANNMAEAGVITVTEATVRAHISAPSFVPFGARFSYRASVTGTSSTAVSTVRLCTRPPSSLLQVNAPGTFRLRGLYCLDIPRLAPGQTAGFDVSATPSRSGRLTVPDQAAAAGLPGISRASAPVLVGPEAACPAVARAGRKPVTRPTIRSVPVARAAC